MRLIAPAALAAGLVLLAPCASATSLYSGHVYDTLGQPVAGVTIRAGSVDPEVFSWVFHTAAETTTAADGSYSIDDLGPGAFGSYIIVASGGGLAMAMYPDHPCHVGEQCLDRNTNNNYAIPPPATGVDFHLPHAAEVSGTLALAGEASFAGRVYLTLHWAASSESAATIVSDREYRFSGLWPGAYKVCIGWYDDETLLPQCYAGLDYDSLDESSVYDQATVIDAGEGESMAADFSLHHASYISGQILSAIDGAPLYAGAFLRRTDGSSGDYEELGGGIGAYSIKVAPGEFEIGFWSDDWYVPQYVAAPVTVGTEQNVVVDAHLVPRATMEGTVVDAQTQQPLPGVRVVAKSSESYWWSPAATTDASGHFFLQGAGAGLSYVVSTEAADGHVNMVYPASPVGPGQNPTMIVLASDEHRTGLDLALPPGASISGRIHDAETDAPVEGAVVRIIQLGGVEWGSGVLSGADGSYRTSAVPAGTYFVKADLPSTSYLWPDIRCAYPWTCDYPSADAIALDDVANHPGYDFALPNVDMIMHSGFD